MGAVADIVEDTFDAVGDAVGSVVEAVGDVVESVVDNVVTPVMDTVSNVVEAAMEDPLGTAAKVATAVYAPYLLPVTNAAVTLANGGDMEDAFKSAAAAYVAPQVGGYVGSEVGSMLGETAGRVAAGATGAATGAAISGGDISTALVTGGVSAATPLVLKEIPGYTELPKYAQDMVRSTVAAELTGRDPSDALVNSAINSGINAVANYNATGSGTSQPPAPPVVDDTTADNDFFAGSGEPVPAAEEPEPGFDAFTPDLLPESPPIDMSEYPVQDFGEGAITEQNLQEFQNNLSDIWDKGGYTSQWQTVGGDRVMVNDDGTAIGINENGDSYALAKPEVDQMVQQGLLNSESSGYYDATGQKPADGTTTPAVKTPSIGVSTAGGALSALSPTTSSSSGALQSVSATGVPQASAGALPGSMLKTPVSAQGASNTLQGGTGYQSLYDPTRTAAQMSVAPGSNFMSENTQMQIDPQLAQILAQRAAASNPGYYTYGKETGPLATFNSVSMDPLGSTGVATAPTTYANGGSAMASPLMAARGGNVPHKGSHWVQGAGGGQDDLIDARLADGEYVFDADIVAALGDGSNKEGARKLDEMRKAIRAHKRSAPDDKIPPKAKHPLQYLKGVK